MRTLSSAVLVAVAAMSAPGSIPAHPSDVDNVAAFARLYGVVRYFYPSDAAAGLDWNRFAVLGVARVRTARDTPALAAALESLFDPLGPGIEIGARFPAAQRPSGPDQPLVAWRYFGPGFVSSGGYTPYKARRTHRLMTSGIDGFVTLMQTVPAQTLRGKAIRLRGQVRASPADASGSAALWLRVDRAEGGRGFFDNMGGRPIREPQWGPYTIEGSVSDDAVAVAFGAMASGAVTADFDAIELAARSGDGDWAPIAVKDPGFEGPGEDIAATGWHRAGTSQTAVVSRPAEGAPEGDRFLRFSPPSADSANDLFEAAAPTAGAHLDLDLGAGLKARVPLALRDGEARLDAAGKASLDALGSALSSLPGPGEQPDLDQRLADVVVAWNVFRHFYPYWTETGVDWDARLRPQLRAAREAATRAAQLDALRGLVADARDGHGSVRDTLDRRERARLPVGLAVVDGHLVITASAVPSEAPVGAVVSAIDGVPATVALARRMSLSSGTVQWRQVRAAMELTTGPKDAAARLDLDDGGGKREARLTYGANAVPEKRPERLTELRPGIWYVDLTRVKMAELAPALEKLAGARGVVFDVRGYPTDAGFQILPHLIDAPEADRWMHVAKLVGPFGESEGWESRGWNLQPAGPRLRGKIVFLTDGRAISYAESVMGYVRDRSLGTIVGSATAGTNGNVATFAVPGGFIVSFTGMRVTGHDGKRPHHLVGVRPDLEVAPTIAGLRAGRDEVLEQAMELLRGGG
jgi:hypothetical protein